MAAPSREVIAPSCSRASPRAGPSRAAAAGEFRYAREPRGRPAAPPRRSRSPRRGRPGRAAPGSPPRGIPSPEGPRREPAPSGVHIMNHPLPVPRPASGRRGGWRVLGGHRGCVNCYVLLTLGCLPLPTDYPFDHRQANHIVKIFCSIPVGSPSTGHRAGESRSRSVRDHGFDFPASLVQYVRLARAITVLGCAGPETRSVSGSRAAN